VSEVSDIREELLYSTEHEWLRIEDGLARVGITAYAQEQLGDVVYVLLPEPGRVLTFMGKLGEIESVKVASEIFSPVAGEVIEINEALTDAPELVNKDPYGEGWLVTVRPTAPEEVDKLLNAQAYRDLVRLEQGEQP
jgi:glycine cleavage system H protein